MYKILDTDSNTHVIFDSYTDACAFKGLDPKKAYKVKRNTKDRPIKGQLRQLQHQPIGGASQYLLRHGP